MRPAEIQIATMRRDWPDFRLTGRAGNRLTWKGYLQPLGMRYLVQVSLSLPKRNRFGSREGGVPRVTVLTPELRRRAAAPDDRIPHIYPNDRQPERPFLCLYDPARKEWTNNLLVCETIIPWSIEWLACYEAWHATGEWVGGGRHPNEPV